LSGREACFERVCVAAEDYDRAIKNEAEGCGEGEAAARIQKMLPITSTTLITGVKILQIPPWMPKVNYSLLLNGSLCMGLKSAMVVFSFQLGRIAIFRAYTTFLVAGIRFGGTMSTSRYG